MISFYITTVSNFCFDESPHGAFKVTLLLLDLHLLQTERLQTPVDNELLTHVLNDSLY